MLGAIEWPPRQKQSTIFIISAEKEKAAALTVKGAAKDAAASDRSPAAARPRIKVEGLTKRFAKTLAVDDIDFDIPAGSFTALLGGNGAGKTTTIAMLLGLVSPTAGNIEILGHDLSCAPAAALAQMNFQSPYVDLPRRLTVRQNLNVYGRLYGVLALKDRIAELADAPVPRRP